jgi:hypothetical protein
MVEGKQVLHRASCELESGGAVTCINPRAVLTRQEKPGRREYACAGELAHWESKSIQQSSALSEEICVPRNSIRNVDSTALSQFTAM